MDIRKVKKLIEMLEESNLNEIEIKEGEEAVKLVKSNPIPGNFISSAPAIISEPTQQSPIAMPSAPSSEATVTQEISYFLKIGEENLGVFKNNNINVYKDPGSEVII